MRVMVALDDSIVSARAAREAVRLFSGDPGAEFLVINVAVVPVAWVGGGGFGAVAPMVIDPRWLDPHAAVEDDHDREQLLMAEATAIGLADAEVMVRSGDAAEQICAAAADHDVDVIVVGSHAKSALRRLFDPSVAAGVIASTSLPVLVVRSQNG